VPELDFRVLSAGPEPQSLIPIINFRLGITESAGHPIDTIVLRCQIMIEAARRRYAEREQEALLDLFGEPSRWGRTLKTMLWTHASTVVPGFTGETAVDLPVPCTYDLSVSAGKYYFALEDGDVPLTLQFSGTTFWRTDDDRLSVAPIPWTKEATFRLPVSTWRGLMEEHYPGTAWLCLRREVVDRLNRYKSHRGLPGWDQAVDGLLDSVEQTAAPGQAKP
jgi:hypothetical protein